MIIKILRIVDNIVLLAENKESLEKVLNGIEKLLVEEFGLNIRGSKTEVMKVSMR